jgi:hypothetical protein
MNSDKIINSLLDQYDRALELFRIIIHLFPEKEWQLGEIDYLRPAGVAYHLVETIEFYCSDKSADEFGWGGRFGCDWEDHDSTRLPTQTQITLYLDDVWLKTRIWVSLQDVLQPETLFPWTGSIMHSRLLYLLRHIQHHTAEMNLELKRRGYQSPDWK